MISLIVINKAVVNEIKSTSQSIRQKEKWITIGENDGPAHIHINSELIKSYKFIKEEKTNHASYSIRFYDENGKRVLSAFFTKMYNENKTLNLESEEIYNKINHKFGSKLEF